MERRGDAACQQLPLGLDQRKRGRKGDAGARLELTLERIAVHIDDAREHQHSARIDGAPGGAAARIADGCDRSGGQHDGRGRQTVFGEHDPAGDAVEGRKRSVAHGSNTICTRGVGYRDVPNSMIVPDASTLMFSVISTGRVRGIRSSSASLAWGRRALTRVTERR